MKNQTIATIATVAIAVSFSNSGLFLKKLNFAKTLNGKFDVSQKEVLEVADTIDPNADIETFQTTLVTKVATFVTDKTIAKLKQQKETRDQKAIETALAKEALAKEALALETI